MELSCKEALEVLNQPANFRRDIAWSSLPKNEPYNIISATTATAIYGEGITLIIQKMYDEETIKRQRDDVRKDWLAAQNGASYEDYKNIHEKRQALNQETEMYVMNLKSPFGTPSHRYAISVLMSDPNKFATIKWTGEKKFSITASPIFEFGQVDRNQIQAVTPTTTTTTVD